MTTLSPAALTRGSPACLSDDTMGQSLGQGQAWGPSEVQRARLPHAPCVMKTAASLPRQEQAPRASSSCHGGRAESRCFWLKLGRARWP
jgi:hypothetical protein